MSRALKDELTFLELVESSFDIQRRSSIPRVSSREESSLPVLVELFTDAKKESMSGRGSSERGEKELQTYIEVESLSETKPEDL